MYREKHEQLQKSYHPSMAHSHVRNIQVYIRIVMYGIRTVSLQGGCVYKYIYILRRITRLRLEKKETLATKENTFPELHAGRQCRTGRDRVNAPAVQLGLYREEVSQSSNARTFFFLRTHVPRNFRQTNKPSHSFNRLCTLLSSPKATTTTEYR